jgi:SAM-dependent methyltransferase
LISGAADFLRARWVFEHLVRHYGIRFRSATDIGCGTGLFACYLNRRWGVPVFGVDRSPEMLAVARRNCPNMDVCFIQQDFRELCLPWPVELATANACTLNHLMCRGHLQRSFGAIYDNLVPGSYLIFDLITDHQPAHWIGGCTRRLQLGRSAVWHRLQWHPGRKQLTITITQSAMDSTPPATETYIGRGYALPEVDGCLRRAGFLLRGIYDAATHRLATRRSHRVIVVAVRK